jgi:hypothetical protein
MCVTYLVLVCWRFSGIVLAFFPIFFWGDFLPLHSAPANTKQDDKWKIHQFHQTSNRFLDINIVYIIHGVYCSLAGKIKIIHFIQEQVHLLFSFWHFLQNFKYFYPHHDFFPFMILIHCKQQCISTGFWTTITCSHQLKHLGCQKLNKMTAII